MTDDAIFSDIARLALTFGEVKRATFHPDVTTAESDTTHSIMLALLACEINDRYAYNLSPGWLCSFAVVHDLVEAECGDTSTLGITSQGRAAKEARESAALKRLCERFAGTWLIETIAKYEAQRLPEARLIKLVDKILPKLTHRFNGGIAFARQSKTIDEIKAIHDKQAAELREKYGHRFPEVVALVERTAHQAVEAYRLAGLAVDGRSAIAKAWDAAAHISDVDQYSAGAGDCDGSML